MSDRQTIAWYDGAAETYAGRRTPMPRHLSSFMALLPPGGTVLDLGCGAGNASAALADAGFTVTGIDASAGLLALARRAAPQATFVEAEFAMLDDLARPGSIDGVWCNFALLHAPRAEMPDHLARVARSLRPGGVFHLALMLGEGQARDRLGRFYTYYRADEIRGLLADAGFSPLDETESDSTSAAGDPVRCIILLGRRA